MRSRQRGEGRDEEIEGEDEEWREVKKNEGHMYSSGINSTNISCTQTKAMLKRYV